MLNTLNDVLEFAQLDAGEVTLQPSALDLIEEVQALIAEHKPDADAKNLPIHLQTDVGALPVLLDRDAVRKVLGNIVDNAIKFTTEGTVRVTVESTRDLINVHVADTGEGMDEDFLPHLFTEFKQESAGLARSHEGNGLGIAIAKHLVDLMGGRINALSRKGAGSVISVALPRSPVPVPTFAGDGATGQADATASPMAPGMADQ